MKLLRKLALSACASGFLLGNANAGVIDFENLVPRGAAESFSEKRVGGVILRQGFGGFIHNDWFAGTAHSGTSAAQLYGSNDLFAVEASQDITLHSIWVNLVGSGDSTYHFAVTAVGRDGTRTSVTHDFFSGPQWVKFDIGLTGQYISFGGVSVGVNVDDIDVSLGAIADGNGTVPEPATMLTFATGLLMMGRIARRRKN